MVWVVYVSFIISCQISSLRIKKKKSKTMDSSNHAPSAGHGLAWFDCLIWSDQNKLTVWLLTASYLECSPLLRNPIANRVSGHPMLDNSAGASVLCAHAHAHVQRKPFWKETIGSAGWILSLWKGFEQGQALALLILIHLIHRSKRIICCRRAVKLWLAYRVCCYEEYMSILL